MRQNKYRVVVVVENMYCELIRHEDAAQTLPAFASHWWRIVSNVRRGDTFAVIQAVARLR